MRIEEVEVVVVGAGASGLHAARLLAGRGHSVTLLEARDRVGGRLLNHDGDQGPLDLGATWFWPGESRVETLSTELGLAVHSQYLNGDALYHDRPQAQRLDGNPIDVPSGRFGGGAAALTDALALGLPSDLVRLNSPVRSIETAIDKAVVRHDGGVVQAEHVILAMPPALVAHAIEIIPPLPQPLAGLAAITPVWMGAVVKVVAVFETPFWRHEGLAGAAISHLGPLREIHDMCGPDGSPAALFGFAPLSPGQQAPHEDEVRAQLIEIFGEGAANPLKIVIQDWSVEEFTSPPQVASLSNYQTFGHPRFGEPTGHGRLHWASTETATESPGHIEGALAASERATKAVVRSLADSERTSERQTNQTEGTTR